MAKGKDAFSKVDRLLLQSIIDLFPSFFFARDKAGRFLLVNKAAAHAYGSTPDEMSGKTNADFNVDSDISDEHLANDLEAMQSRREKVVEAEPLFNVTGDTVYLDTKRLALPPRLFGRSDVVLAVSEVVKQHNGNDAKFRELEQRLVNAEEMESVGVLASGIAHDLNNLLSPLMGYPELIRRQVGEDNPICEMLAEIENASIQASELIQGLLTMARRSTKKPEVVDVNELLKSFEKLGMVKDNLKIKPFAAFSLSLDVSAPRITVSPSSLQQILINLIQNAFEAIDERGSIIVKSVKVSRPIDPNNARSPNQTWVGISVVDDGAGIKKADKDRILEPFFSTKKMGRSGTGLGLSVVSGLVDDGGGIIEVKSKAMEGSTFSVYFPSTEQDLAAEEPCYELPTLKAKVLFIDDLSMQRKLATHFLESLGCSVVCADGGRKAVEIIRRENFDLCIIDMVMEDDMDGLDTFRAIQHVQPNVPCIIATGYAKTDRINKALTLGVKAYLKKPFTLQNLAEEMVKVLN